MLGMYMVKDVIAKEFTTEANRRFNEVNLYRYSSNHDSNQPQKIPTPYQPRKDFSSQH